MSSTDLPIGPIDDLTTQVGMKLSSIMFLSPNPLTLSGVGFNPLIPLNALGTLMLPPRSLPSANGIHLEAINPPSPPELPPHDLSFLIGFFAHPHILLSECIEYAN
jgi:hypothetical protein